MTSTSTITARRAQRFKNLFPGDIPTLWCPSLTHYDANGALDRQRIGAHLRHLSAHVKGFLVPGSTGDGWELNDQETRQLLGIVLDEVAELGCHLLVGILKTDSVAALSAIGEILHWIKARTNERDSAIALAKAHVCGFTVCPAHGKDRSQEELQEGLASILELGLPTAIYQLPQVTQNELSPEVTHNLAQQFDNFLFFKDSSGADRVALSGKNLDGVFTMRGAEDNYARWLNVAGGPYHGFLLSTANCFAKELSQMIDHLSAKRLDAAQQSSARLSSVIKEVFHLVEDLPHGNPYANANKAMDHFFAYGPGAAQIAPPRLHDGAHLTVEVIRAAGEILSRHGLLPQQGYLPP